MFISIKCSEFNSYHLQMYLYLLIHVLVNQDVTYVLLGLRQQTSIRHVTVKPSDTYVQTSNLHESLCNCLLLLQEKQTLARMNR